MGNSILIGSLLGPLVLVIGISLVFNTQLYLKMIKDFIKEPVALFVSAMRGFVIGLVMIQNNNIWSMTWEMIITILGWAILIKSTLLLLIPNFFYNFAQKCKFPKEMLKIVGIIYALFGIIIIYKTMM
ncbi:MAG: hypothetical protein PHG82_05480 [Candidatus Gracilibacteria bacterium]|nr:hypothetical protein [Candidatus Gracilibacteria bacterium]